MTQKTKQILMWLLDGGLNLGVIIALVFTIQTWIIAPFDVSGSSMCNTLNIIDGECQSSFGEKIIINEALYLINDPQRDDIVVFKAPHGEGEEERYFIKRVIGIPGDKVKIQNGDVYRQTPEDDSYQKLAEPYLNEQNSGNTNPYHSNFNTFEVPEGKYFLLGDNRIASTDSRSCFTSTLDQSCPDQPERAYIDRSNIRGKAWVVWWPLSNLRILGGEVELQ